MTRLLCSGKYLDLPDGAGLQFTHDNPLFAFDSIKCERTTNFKLPTTPTNDSVLSLARVPAYKGTGMRLRLNAQLQDGIVVKDGYLYVSDFDGSVYNATFVTGELVGLQAIKNLGKIGEIMTYTDSVQIGVGTQPPYAAHAADLRWANVNYARPQSALQRPSICLAKIYEDVCTQQGITAAALPTAANELWLISKGNGINRTCQFKNEIIDLTQPQASVPADPFNALTYDPVVFDMATTSYGIVSLNTSASINQHYLLEQYKAKTDIVIEIPDNWDNDLYFIDLSFTHNDPDSGAFYGDRWFTGGNLSDEDTHIYTYGESLRGRSVKILAGECFSIVSSACYEYFRTPRFGGGYNYNQGFFLHTASAGEYEMDLTLVVKSADNNLKIGDLCLLQDNLPDITFVELLKVFAYVSGRVLNYSENGYTNIISVATITSQSNVTYDRDSCTITSTRTNNTNPASNYLNLYKFNGSTPVATISNFTNLGAFTQSFTKDATWDTLRIGFNGNMSDATVDFSIPDTYNGKTLTLWGTITILDRTGTGNDGQVKNLCLVEGSSAVTWSYWKLQQKGISFEELDYTKYPQTEIVNLTKRGKVARTFGKYGQNNIVNYKSDDSVRENISAVYTIENENLADTYSLAQIPFSEGDYWTDIPVWVFVTEEVKQEVLGSEMGQSAALWRVALPKNTGLQGLCTASTQYEIECHMTLAEYNDITPKTILLVDNTRYVWTSRSWQKDTAKFTLAKLP